MKKTKKDTRSITIIICVSVLVIALGFIFTLMLYPSIMARSTMRDISETLESEVTEIIITYPEQANIGFSTGGEINLCGEQTTEITELLRSALQEASYSHKNDQNIGNWDIRLRIFTASDEVVSLYVTEEGTFYFSRGITQFHFSSDHILALYEAITDQ